MRGSQAPERRRRGSGTRTSHSSERTDGHVPGEYAVNYEIVIFKRSPEARESDHPPLRSGETAGGSAVSWPISTAACCCFLHEWPNCHRRGMIGDVAGRYRHRRRFGAHASSVFDLSTMWARGLFYLQLALASCSSISACVSRKGPRQRRTPSSALIITRAIQIVLMQPRMRFPTRIGTAMEPV